MHNLTPSSLSRARCALFTAALGALTALGSSRRRKRMPPSEQPPGTTGPGGGAPPGNPMCQRLEGQLALIDRGGDPAKADQIRRYEDAAAKQQGELDRVTAQAKRMGCDSSGFFSLFSSNSAQCGPVNNQIQQMRGNLDQINNGLAQLRGGGNADRDNQRRSVLTALAQNNCGPQYVHAARAPRKAAASSTTCSATTTRRAGPTWARRRRPTKPSAFAPATASISRFPTRRRRAVSPTTSAPASSCARRPRLRCTRSAIPAKTSTRRSRSHGQPYSALPNAFKYRQEFNPSCSCKAPARAGPTR